MAAIIELKMLALLTFVALMFSPATKTAPLHVEEQEKNVGFENSFETILTTETTTLLITRDLILREAGDENTVRVKRGLFSKLVTNSIKNCKRGKKGKRCKPKKRCKTASQMRLRRCNKKPAKTTTTPAPTTTTTTVRSTTTLPTTTTAATTTTATAESTVIERVSSRYNSHQEIDRSTHQDIDKSRGDLNWALESPEFTFNSNSEDYDEDDENYDEDYDEDYADDEDDDDGNDRVEDEEAEEEVYVNGDSDYVEDEEMEDGDDVDVDNEEEQTESGDLGELDKP